MVFVTALDGLACRIGLVGRRGGGILLPLAGEEKVICRSVGVHFDVAFV